MGTRSQCASWGMKLGADANLATVTGTTPIYIASQNGHLAVVRLLGIELKADVDKAKNDGATPTVIASQMGKLDMVKCLVDELGADMHKATKEGGTPVQIASAKVHKEIVRFLIKRGADLDTASKFGTAADLAAQHSPDPTLAD